MSMSQQDFYAEPGGYGPPPMGPGPAGTYLYPQSMSVIDQEGYNYAPAPHPGPGFVPPPTGIYPMQSYPQPVPTHIEGPSIHVSPPGPPPPMVDGASDHPDLYIPEHVRQVFLPYFYQKFKEKNLGEILNIYEVEFNKLSDRFFVEYPWPNADLIAPIVKNAYPLGIEYHDPYPMILHLDESFLVLYKELQFRHIYAKHKPTLEQRFDSFHNYIDLFNLILGSSEAVDIELPNQWLWDIIDEFIYQFQTFVQFRGKLKSRSSEEIQKLRDAPNVWNIHSMINVLYSLVDKSNINKQLEAYYAGEDPASVAGEFGNHSLYKNLGYFSLIGLLRLHCQLGDYNQALQSVANVQLSKKVLATTRVPAGQISLYYYVGFCYLMMRRYKDTIRTFSNIIVFIQRAKSHFQPKSYQHDMVLKRNDQMLNIVAMVLTLYPQHVDEVVNSQLREIRFQEKLAHLQKGEVKAYEEMFLYACPKFLSPVPPDYESLPENYNKEPTHYQASVFMAEIEQQLIIPVLRSYLKFYTTMPISKLAGFMDIDEGTLQEHLLRFKHKTRGLVSTAKGMQHLSGELQSASDLDFYIDGEMLHIADTKLARRYGDFFIRQIHKLDELCIAR